VVGLMQCNIMSFVEAGHFRMITGIGMLIVSVVTLLGKLFQTETISEIIFS